ncbi:MAG TPA: ribbon-helix-helix protein, CopG family [Thermoanaerobaculia bacterium]
MQKTETADWPEPRSLKEELEEAARSRQTSVADLLEEIVREWLERSQGTKANETEEDEEERQKRLHAAIAPLIGSIHGGDPYRAENARSEIQKRLASKYGR